MYDKTEIKVLELIYLYPHIHKRELAKRLNLGMPSIDYALQKIKKMVKKQEVGNQIQFMLDYAEDGLGPALSLVEYARLERLPAKIKLSIKDFLRELKDKPLIALIFGSYANDTYTPKSDIDILLVFQKIVDTKHIESTAKKTAMKTNTLLNPVYLDYSTFLESFHNSTKEFFKRLKKDKLILVGIEWWRLLEHEEA